ncbi:hypothetical protein HNQ44_001456 [Planomicrobium koreense]|uniref:Uncharacterized protein n=1 Tax=Planococcus koreensis TaxID=112331 RepID=A0A7W8CTQ8_9BACL|nr:hypothetical protein [Planococcus koreensis]
MSRKASFYILGILMIAVLLAIISWVGYGPIE